MSADPQTWTDLKTSLATWIVRDDQTDRIPEYIALAERRLNREVYCRERNGDATLTAAASITLPTDFGGANTVWLDTDPKVTLDPMPLGVLHQAYSSSATGAPGNYAISGTTMILGPLPDSAYSVRMSYWKTLEPLSATVASNWLLLAHSDLYLSASLTEMFLGVYDDERAMRWDARTIAKIAEVNRFGIREQHGGTPFRIRSAVVV
jgi:hypothetical protein